MPPKNPLSVVTREDYLIFNYEKSHFRVKFILINETKLKLYFNSLQNELLL